MAEEVWSEPPSERAARHERKEPRTSMFLTAMMRLGFDEPRIPLLVRNVSPGGLMADCTTAVEQGWDVEIELGKLGAVRGVIAWVDSRRIGVRFAHRIDPQLARKSVGTHAGEQMLVKPPRQRARRSGLRIE